jgi:hypothetical protein
MMVYRSRLGTVTGSWVPQVIVLSSCCDWPEFSMMLAGWSALMAAARDGHMGAVRQLLGHEGGRASIDAVNNYGRSALWYACFWGHAQVGPLGDDDRMERDRINMIFVQWGSSSSGH